MFVFLPVRQQWACHSTCHSERRCGGEERVSTGLCMSRGTVRRPMHNPTDLPGASLQGTVSFWVSNVPPVGKENDVCEGANCLCLSKVQESAESWGGIYSSETSQCPATSEQAAATIYGSAHRQMLRAGLGCAFKRSDV